MTVPDIRDEIMHMRKTERLYRDTLIRIRKGGFVLKLTRVVAVATASAGLPGIIADRKIGWSVSILGFIGMTVNEWAVRRQTSMMIEMDFVLDVIDDRLVSLNDEVMRRYEKRNEIRKP